MRDHLGFSTPTHHIFKQKYVFSILGFFFSKFKICTTHTKSWCGCCVDFWVFGRVLFRGGSRGLWAKVFDKFYDSSCRWRRCWLCFTIWQNNYFSDPVYTMHWVLVYSGSEKYLFGLNYTLCVRHRLYFVCIGCGVTQPRTFHRIILWDIQFIAQGVMMKLQHSWPPVQKTVLFVNLYNINNTL